MKTLLCSLTRIMILILSVSMIADLIQMFEGCDRIAHYNIDIGEYICEIPAMTLLFLQSIKEFQNASEASAL